jgi:hypothetical protein
MDAEMFGPVAAVRELRTLKREAAALSGRLRVFLILPPAKGERRTGHDRSQPPVAAARPAVIDVAFGVEGVIVIVRLRRRRRVCGCCGRPVGNSRSTTGGSSAAGTSISALTGA